MITVLRVNFAQVSATQTQFRCELNYQIKPKTNKGKCEAKRHKVMEYDQRLWNENKLCKEHN